MKNNYIQILKSFPETLILDISFFLKDFVCHYPRISSSDVLTEIKSKLSPEYNLKIDSILKKTEEGDDDYFLLDAINQVIYEKTTSNNKKIKNRVKSILQKIEVNNSDTNINEFEISIGDITNRNITKSKSKETSSIEETVLVAEKTERREKVDIPQFSAGDTITVYYEVDIDNRKSIESFKGVVIQRRGSHSSETFTIRKMSGTVGVERIFPLNMLTLKEIEINKKGTVQRKRIYFFREISDSKKKIRFRKK